MKRSRRFPAFVALLFVTVSAIPPLAQADTINIVVSPSTLNLSSNGGCVTVHAEIAYGAVTGVELTVNGQGVNELSTFPDNRGELVVRCDIQTIKAMVSPGTATFDLVMHTSAGDHTGTDTIRVIECGE